MVSLCIFCQQLYKNVVVVFDVTIGGMCKLYRPTIFFFFKWDIPFCIYWSGRYSHYVDVYVRALRNQSFKTSSIMIAAIKFASRKFSSYERNKHERQSLHKHFHFPVVASSHEASFWFHFITFQSPQYSWDKIHFVDKITYSRLALHFSDIPWAW